MMTSESDLPLPLMLETLQHELLCRLLSGTSWEGLLRRKADAGREREGEFRQIRLTIEELDSLWELTGSAMDAFPKEAFRLESIQAAISVAMDGF